ncbi:adenylosuccinate lyase [Pontimicrobium aquaticum]|uniref:Adenylosuccinate lyase n=1 Tax=Pontimicrobium aquaticum TaxID=2565367 RepID=A0A4U0EUM6_9FLAO|nr:adenylosuccinate lyase [Pontimicrobium aquaticum]TJY34112.1 adenylosuccinate lyase [Pontimicrobium aquaticum]
MTKEELYKELSYVNHSRDNRKKYALLVISNPDLIPKVLDILFQVNDKTSCRAAWLLEFVARENLDAILPYLDSFIKNMHTVHLDPAVRPVAKICEYLIEACYSKTPNHTKDYLKPEHKEKIIELSFDYMITDQKVAAKAYSMNSLYLLGKEFDWIHPELIMILERDFNLGSAAFKARARHLIKKLRK